MLIKEIEKYSRIHGKVDAFMIVNKDDVIQYSAMVDDGVTFLTPKNVIGKNLFEMYPNLTRESSTHCRVMATGKPILDEQQLIIEKNGRAYVINTSTFPIEYHGEIIGTFDVSSNYTSKSKKEDTRNKLYTVDSIVTQNEAMMMIKNRISKVAKNDSNVMVIGESGTGKELVVEAIHSASARAGKPFISLNCAAIPDTLMESTLFGTVKGSFTGAENRKGVFELANGGTLFLDEINSMNMELQAKLLKAVEEQKYMKIGGETYIDVNVRILSAMNVDPREAIRNKTLRQDLFFRLGVIQFFLPPLRERKEDIRILADHFIDFYNRKMNKSVEELDISVEQIFKEYSWPGNVRELRNVIESSFNMTEDEYISLIDIPEYLSEVTFEELQEESTELRGMSLSDKVDAYEKKLLVDTLQQVRSISEASRVLKMTRQAIKYKIEKYDIDYKELWK
ncbi:MAG: sigma 54-interacting transcriptional regulator [Firmicutes bacterium]|nr:sigma 54-interacting transcriptional regulator [Bacillota bacterium]